MLTSDMYEESIMPRLSHSQILERMDKVCQSKLENNHKIPDDMRLQYLFFVANVPSRSNIHKDSKYYLGCMLELLNHASKFL